MWHVDAPEYLISPLTTDFRKISIGVVKGSYMYLGLDTDIGSQPLFEGELLDTNSGNPVNIASPKLQRETDSAGTPTSKLLFDYTIAQVENNSNRIDKSVLKADFCNTLDKTCQEVHQQNCEELSKQSLENALEIQGRVEKVSHIDIGSLSPLFEGELLDDIGSSPPLFAGDPLDTNSGDPVNIALPKLQRETDSAGTPDVTAQNLVVNFEAAPLQPSKINNDFPKTAFLPPNFAQLQELSKQSPESALEFQNRADEDFIKKKVSDIDSPSPLFEGELLNTNSGDPVNIALPKLQQQTDSASTPASKLLSDDTIAEVENNSNRIDESVLKENFHNLLDEICQEKHHQNFEELSKQSLKNALEIQGEVYEDFTKEKVKLSKKQLVSPDRYKYPCIVNNCAFTHIQKTNVKTHLFKHIKVSQYYCEQCLPHTLFVRDKSRLNRHIRRMHSTGSTLSEYRAKRMCPPVQNTMNGSSGFTVNQVSDQQKTDSASTPASKLLFDVTAQNLVGNFTETPQQPSKINTDFPENAFLPPNFEQLQELFKQSLENALEFQCRADENVTTQNLVGNFTETPQQPSKINNDFPKTAFLPPNFEQLHENFIKEKVSDIGSLLFEGELPEVNSDDQIDTVLPKLQRETDSASTPASNLLSDYTIAQVENNSKYQDHCNQTFSSSNTSNSKDSRKKANSQILSRIDENVLKTGFYTTLDKKCQEKYHQNFEELSKQSLKDALEFQGGVYQDFTEKKVSLFEKQLVPPGRYEYPCIVTDCSFTHKRRRTVKRHLFKHIKVSPYYCEQCLPHTFFVRDMAALNRHKSMVHVLNKVISKRDIKRIHQPVQNTMNGSSGFTVNQVSDQQKTDSASTPASNLLSDYTIAQVENNSKYQDHCNQTFSSSNTSNSKDSRKKANSQILSRIDENVLKTGFYTTLDKKCQEKYHQNFEELSKQSLKDALEFQGGVYQDFTEKKVSLFEKQLVPPGRYEYPCIVTDCSFTHKRRRTVKRHLFKHIKVSPYYCEQCLPHTFFVRDMAALNRHKSMVHVLNKVISKRDIKRIHQPVQNTMNGSSGFTVNQVSDQQKTDSASTSTQASKLLFDVTAQNLVVDFESALLQPSKINNDFPKTAFLPPNFEQLQNNSNRIDKICQEVHHQNCEELSKQSLENALEFQNRADEDFIKEKVSHIDIGSLPPLFAGDPLDTNSGDPVNIALPKLQRETDSASTPASKLLSDVTAQNLVGNFEATPLQPIKINNDFPKTAFLPPNFGQLLSDYIIAKQSLENALNTDFCNTLDKICQGVHHQNCEELVTAQNLVGNFTETPQQPGKINTDFPENAFLPPNFAQLQELSKQSLENASESQGRADEDFIKKKVSHIDIGSLLFEGELLNTNSGDPVNIALPKLHRETDSASTPASKLLSDDTIAEVENNSNRIDESVLKENFHNLLDEICQEKHHQNFEELSKQSLKKALKFQGRVYRDFTKKKAELSKKQLVSPGEYKYPCIVNNCAFTHIQKINIKTHLFKHIKVSPHYCEQCLPHTFFARDMGALNAHKKSLHSLDTAIPKRGIKRIHQPVQNTMNGSSGFTVNQVSGQQQTDSAGTPASNLLSDDTIAEVENNSNRIDKICQEVHHQNCEELSKQSPENALEFQGRADEDFIKEKVSDIDSLSPSPSPLFEGELLDTNSGGSVNIALPKLQQQTDSASTPASKLLSDDTISESVLKEDFYKTLDKKCQEEHHQNFEELSKQSLKNALEIQGEFYKNFIKEKVKLSKKQLVSPGEYKYPCIVTDCSFTEEYRSQLGVHLFKHIKVSPYYCEQCLPHTFFARDTAVLNAHKKKVHSLDTAISKRSIKRKHKPVQNTMNGSSRFNVNQVSDPYLLSRAKQAKIDP